MKRSFSVLFSAGLVIAVSVLVTACKQEVATAGRVTKANATSKQAVMIPKVTTIVFIGKKNACDCTRERVDNSFAALPKTLKGHSGIEIVKLQVDVDEESVVRFQKLRPIMVLPAIYLFESSGALLDVLQGEVTVAQLQKAVGGG